ncbi:hypothetical protein [Caldicellulosiruptor acetigenus]|uniref:Uncharacterized protein n=1 Tax=Caldicellulosiruptor acetigenus 6A TaxID=632516 RepID=E4K6B9_9FIRM|nr:hypothetical protein [Caldicellulosiruptor acetigenus]AEM72925.1 hypothetical protein Calla_0245 [Caldicellulosiruptor acetigenus 6A]AEM73566.1 hypothetical protein Calla_0924 [Caldicellulosiruptor acetigenus 6A]
MRTKTKRNYIDEWYFFKNDKGKIQYHSLCEKCQKNCKQSFRVKEIHCPKYMEK